MSKHRVLAAVFGMGLAGCDTMIADRMIIRTPANLAGQSLSPTETLATIRASPVLARPLRGDT
jgi:hypothetical protein